MLARLNNEQVMILLSQVCQHNFEKQKKHILN